MLIEELQGGEVMDHAIEALEVFYEVTLDWFVEEQKRGKYKAFFLNPYYKEIRALMDAMNILRQYMGWETLKLLDEVKRLEEE